MTPGRFNPNRTAWHITVGTYASRLHGGDEPTVDRNHNQRGEPFITAQPWRAHSERDRLRVEPARPHDFRRRRAESVPSCSDKVQVLSLFIFARIAWPHSGQRSCAVPRRS